MNLLQAVRAYFGLDENTTEESAAEHVQDEAQVRAEQLELELKETEQVTEEQPTETAETTETTTSPTVEELQAEMADMRLELTAQIEDLTTKVNQMAELSAAESTAGPKETTEPASSSWMSHPMNQKLRRR